MLPVQAAHGILDKNQRVFAILVYTSGKNDARMVQ
jgi:hypothetical protein